jgi:hypothetical protein
LLVEPLLFVFKFNWDVDDAFVFVVLVLLVVAAVDEFDDESSVFCTRFMIMSIFFIFK